MPRTSLNPHTCRLQETTAWNVISWMYRLVLILSDFAAWTKAPRKKRRPLRKRRKQYKYYLGTVISDISLHLCKNQIVNLWSSS